MERNLFSFQQNSLVLSVVFVDIQTQQKKKWKWNIKKKNKLTDIAISAYIYSSMSNIYMYIYKVDTLGGKCLQSNIYEMKTADMLCFIKEKPKHDLKIKKVKETRTNESEGN